jgi:hypothetical protein
MLGAVIKESYEVWALLGFYAEDFLLDCLIFEDGTDRLSRNIGKKGNSTLRKITKQRRSHLHYGGSLKSRKKSYVIFFL